MRAHFTEAEKQFACHVCGYRSVFNFMRSRHVKDGLQLLCQAIGIIGNSLNVIAFSEVQHIIKLETSIKVWHLL